MINIYFIVPSIFHYVNISTIDGFYMMLPKVRHKFTPLDFHHIDRENTNNSSSQIIVK